ncbi:hypothetical protein NQ317_019024 [Molorchus minor]|uniref:Uncharacterized protein n=1 Tax=Molorchus minor TaxID=1323400 RepID=A0ABQ9IU84_9CUCU|nr:hypothetical protein NQ317_019024 [Molorchus minor]
MVSPYGSGIPSSVKLLTSLLIIQPYVIESLIRCSPCDKLQCKEAVCSNKENQFLEPKAYCGCCDVCITIAADTPIMYSTRQLRRVQSRFRTNLIAKNNVMKMNIVEVCCLDLLNLTNVNKAWCVPYKEKSMFLTCKKPTSLDFILIDNKRQPRLPWTSHILIHPSSNKSDSACIKCTCTLSPQIRE